MEIARFEKHIFTIFITNYFLEILPKFTISLK